MPLALDPVETLCRLDRGGPAGPSTGVLQCSEGSVAAVNARLDALFVRRRPGTVTIGVDDGGNEIGRGRGGSCATSPTRPRSPRWSGRTT